MFVLINTPDVVIKPLTINIYIIYINKSPCEYNLQPDINIERAIHWAVIVKDLSEIALFR